MMKQPIEARKFAGDERAVDLKMGQVIVAANCSSECDRSIELLPLCRLTILSRMKTCAKFPAQQGISQSESIGYDETASFFTFCPVGRRGWTGGCGR
jgi:hypothetical protein